MDSLFLVCEAIAKWLLLQPRSDGEGAAKQCRNSGKAVAKRLRSSGEAIAKQWQSSGKAVAKWLLLQPRNDGEAMAKQWRSSGIMAASAAAKRWLSGSEIAICNRFATHPRSPKPLCGCEAAS